MRRRFGWWIGPALGVLLWSALDARPGQAASVPPRYRFRTFQEGRVKVHFHTEVEAPARRTMSLILEILPRLESRYRVTIPSLDVVVQDALDAPNGLATSFPYPLVEIRTASFDGADSGPTESWLRMVVTHELTHIVHIEQARGIYGAGRRVFGRAPFLFHDALQPTWFIEGLAVREETRGTAFGRGRHTFTKMLVDEAARSGQLGRLDQATLGLDLWPLGNAPYLFGEEFLAWLEGKFGEGAARDVALSHGRNLRPYFDSRTFREVTGIGLSVLWRDFARERNRTASASGDAIQPKLLTTRAVLQTAPRISPDGVWIAYTSRALDRMGEIRLMAKDGTSDHRLTWRLSGSALSWSRDGRFIVFDETNVVRKFESRSDLHRVNVATGRRERLTSGLRASDPDVGPTQADPSPIVFVQRFPDRTELRWLTPGGARRVLTTSTAGTEWSHPRFSPQGDAVVAARMVDGFLDLVLVDPSSGAVTELTHDRAVDAEPAWLDNETIVFRSDRENESFRLFMVNRDGTSLRRLSASPDNAFAPEPDAGTRSVFFAHYGAKGYDIARAPLAEGVAVGAFVDPFPIAQPEPEPYPGLSKPYSAVAALGPRFYTPFTEVHSDEWRLGLATAAVDPLFRVTYGLLASIGAETHKPNALGYVRYDRFLPSFTALARVDFSPSSFGVTRTTEGRLSMDLPLERSVLRSQTMNVTVRRRRETDSTASLDSGTAALIWQLDSTKTYPMSISPVDGFRIRGAATRELKALGSDLAFGKIIADARAYARLGSTVVALRLGGGWTYGPHVPGNAYSVGGLSSPALLDPVGDEPAVLRGFDAPDPRDVSRFGRKLAFGNLDWRIPLSHPQRGYRAFPFFVRHLRLTASLDSAVIGESTLDFRSARFGASIGLGADLFVGHRLPVTLQGGLGQGLNRDGRTVPWFSIGFPF
ncbi:MAG: hypothetical protein ABIR28_01115 [Vicinamibacteria bacterium]